MTPLILNDEQTDVILSAVFEDALIKSDLANVEYVELDPRDAGADLRIDGRFQVAATVGYQDGRDPLDLDVVWSLTGNNTPYNVSVTVAVL